jgi:YD repeat-containing protein
MAYDVDGNLTELKKDTATTRYIYNGENRLVSIESVTPRPGDLKSVFNYDLNIVDR